MTFGHIGRIIRISHLTINLFLSYHKRFGRIRSQNVFLNCSRAAVYFTHPEFGVREHINIPKFHSLQHYITSIRYFGTTNNFNTEMFERLHIDFAKKGWRASNHRDEFPQMTVWVSRQENMKSFDHCLLGTTEAARCVMIFSTIASCTD
ncbi:hypothetical protein CYLTODRAFT_362602 [Cylindrobasidium torrendii FP15055 ss-10]|uniref:Uncharacterized protein n=1 Tax=Cylindrobasidium torrendii FP15055 ss-10 TaxID=1314674 RepID=A0A0D7ATC6_9AGAR|nr:hypothetical protein CYLTODRAFT_362602 [Cylindrobasidium torrendii FP15055 ss-10]